MLAVVVVVPMVWYGMVAIALSQPRIAMAYQRRKKAIDRLCGGLIICLGIRQLIQTVFRIETIDAMPLEQTHKLIPTRDLALGHNLPRIASPCLRIDVDVSPL